MISKRPHAALFFIVLVALVIRLLFLLDHRFAIDSDEAIVGLMAKHISEGGDIPIFYYGQHYMGALEAYLAAVSFRLFGVSTHALQLVPLCFSLLSIVMFFFVGKAVANARVGLLAALFAAIPPPAFLVWGLKARGGFIEVIFIGAVAFYLAIHWLACRGRSIRYPAAVGFVCGIGWWVNNQILYFMVTIAASWAFRAVGVLRCRLARGDRFLWQWLSDCISDVVLGLVMFFVGGGLFWYYNVVNGFPSFSMFQSVDLSTFAGQLYGVVTRALPALMGGRRFWYHSEVFPGAALVSIVVLFVVVLLPLTVSVSGKGSFRGKGAISSARGVRLLVLFIPVCCAVFASSSYGWLVAAPRYLLPVYVAIFILTGLTVDLIYRRSRMLGFLSLVFFLSWNLFALFGDGKAIGGRPLVLDGDRVPLDNTKVIAMLNARGIDHVRCSYWVGYRLAFESKEEVTFSMIGTPYQIRIPEYEKQGRGASVPYLLVKREAQLIAPALRRLGYTFKEEILGDYILLWRVNELYPPAEVIKPLVANVNSNLNTTLAPQLALDGDVSTRWGTGTRQQSGQSIVVRFLTPSRIAGIELRHGGWRQDYPRKLKIELLATNGTPIEVLSGSESVGIHYIKQESDFTVRFPEQEVLGVRLTQEGDHPILDWSIAELVFLRVSSALR